uniref:Uncharacterized protein n=1 Tax=Populus trichocarpa TaxID=3694 RepID=A0A2K1Z163_POPTR
MNILLFSLHTSSCSSFQYEKLRLENKRMKEIKRGCRKLESYLITLLSYIKRFEKLNTASLFMDSTKILGSH